MFKSIVFRNRLVTLAPSQSPRRRRKQRRSSSSSSSVSASASSSTSSTYSLQHLIDDLECAHRDKFVPGLILYPLGWNGSTIWIQGDEVELLSTLIKNLAFRAAQTLVKECRVNKEDTSKALFQLCTDYHSLSKIGIRNKMSFVDVLIDHGACTEYRNGAGRTPIHVCFENEVCLRFFRHMVRHANNIDACNGKGKSVLHLALESGRSNSVEMARILLQHGADPNLRDCHGRVPLVVAALRGTNRLTVNTVIKVDLLLHHGAQIKLIPVQGEAAKIAFQCPKIAVTLLQRGFRIDQSDAEGVSPIHTAFGQWCAWMYLTKNHEDDHFMTILFQGQLSLIHLSLHQANHQLVNLQDAQHNTPLHYACRVHHQATAPFVHALITHGADVNASNSTGFTPLHTALSCSNYIVALLLIQLGARTNTVDGLGRTVFHVADTWEDATTLISATHNGVTTTATATTSTTTTTTTTSDTDNTDTDNTSSAPTTTSAKVSASQHLVEMCLQTGFDFCCVDRDGNLPFMTTKEDTLRYALVHAAACQGLFR